MFGIQIEHRTLAALADDLAHDIAARLQEAIDVRGQALLVVSGGKSPMALFHALRVLPLPWQRITITLTDERCVPNTHADSNALLVRQHLHQDLASAAHFVPLLSDDAPLGSPVSMAQRASSALLALGPADVLVLGMGTDGHTASLFPEAANLPQAMDLMQSPACLAIELQHPPANAPHARITQNLSMLLSARYIVLPVIGTDKYKIMQLATVAYRLDLPVSRLLHQNRAPVTLWVTEQD